MLQSNKLVKKLLGFSSTFPAEIYVGVKNCSPVTDFTRSNLCLIMKRDCTLVACNVLFQQKLFKFTIYKCVKGWTNWNSHCNNIWWDIRIVNIFINVRKDGLSVLCFSFHISSFSSLPSCQWQTPIKHKKMGKKPHHCPSNHHLEHFHKCSFQDMPYSMK